ncbi:MAG: hypothetical protein JWL90_4058 [Chthoniobacteraceae bacterium]|nr:hypothetical protein [Chthoniobacteraceae bacterium]
MKLILKTVLALLVCAAPLIHAASDTDVTIIKVEKVVIEESMITITVTEAKTRITLIREDYDPAFTGDTWHGMPVSRVQVLSNKAIFTIKRGNEAAPGGPLENAWHSSLKAARELQEGKEVDRIAFYEPDIVIKGNMIDSITGPGFLIPKVK